MKKIGGVFLGGIVLKTIIGSTAFAAILVDPVGPYPKNTLGVAGSIYVAGDLAAGTVEASRLGNGSYVDTPAGFRIVDTSSATDTVMIDVFSNTDFTVADGQQLVVTLSTSQDDGSQITLVGAGPASGTDSPATCAASTNCQGSSKSARYTQKSTLRLEFRIQSICAATASSTPLCVGGVVQDSAFATLTQTLRVSIGTTDSTSVGPIASGTAGMETATFTFGITGVGPSFDSSVCAALIPEDYYFPGDGEITLDTSKFVISANGGVALHNYLVFMKDGATPLDPFNGFSDSDIVARFSSSYTTAKVEGMLNTTNGVDYNYTAKSFIENRAGIISVDSCTLANIQAQPISGILSESKCYIATASFQSGHAWPVTLLRSFRDHVLNTLPLGDRIVSAYYNWSSQRAVSLWDSWAGRTFAMRWLMRVQPWVWMTLQIANAQTTAAETPAEASASLGASPYIDRIKSKMEPVPAETSSYLDQEKKRLESESGPQPTDSYSLRLKAKVPPVESSEDYSKKMFSELKTDDRPSVIKTVLDGTYKPKDPYEGHTIRHGAGFRLGVVPGSQVSAKDSNVVYSDIYGTAWNPEVMLHYEYQTFHSEWVGSLGLTADLGFQFDGGFGRLTYPFGNAGLTSRTRFSFIQVPFLLGANYRFNLLRILRPYIAANAGVMGYTELRADSKPDYRGYSFIYSGSLGVSLLLDFFDRATMRDAFLSTGIRHVYLQAEYFKLATLSGSVNFDRGGVYAGFLFEF